MDSRQRLRRSPSLRPIATTPIVHSGLGIRFRILLSRVSRHFYRARFTSAVRPKEVRQGSAREDRGYLFESDFGALLSNPTAPPAAAPAGLAPAATAGDEAAGAEQERDRRFLGIVTMRTSWHKLPVATGRCEAISGPSEICVPLVALARPGDRRAPGAARH